MPLHKIEQYNQGGWGIWHIEETEEELAFDAFEQSPAELVSITKRLEWLAARVLIRQLIEQNNFTYNGLVKDQFGKPFLRDLPLQISLTHSFPYVAAQWHTSLPVGIDLEQPKGKLLNVGPRVLSPEEWNDANSDLTKLCIYWCAKEALYKNYGQRGLHFAQQLLVEPFETKLAGFLKGSIHVNDQKQDVTLEYRVENDFVVVLTKHS
ncbi:MAG: 4'-phosphopantetheinyl transferase superfamily protein [Bacteroidetes bacterium]|nr:4'-phosphopantetheinyl transferase superfamily protein [Bacteroidota bacterium]